MIINSNNVFPAWKDALKTLAGGIAQQFVVPSNSQQIAALPVNFNIFCHKIWIDIKFWNSHKIYFAPHFTEELESWQGLSMQ